MLVSLIVGAAAHAAVAAEEPIMKAGTESVTTSDILYLLGQRAGGNEAVAGMIVSGMSAEEKQSFVREIGDLLLVFQAAQLKGIHLEPALAAKVRWDTVNTIAQAYVEREAQPVGPGEKGAERLLQAQSGLRGKGSLFVAHIGSSSSEARTRVLQILAAEILQDRPGIQKDQGAAEKAEAWLDRKGYTVPARKRRPVLGRQGRIVGP